MTGNQPRSFERDAPTSKWPAVVVDGSANKQFEQLQLATHSMGGFSPDLLEDSVEKTTSTATSIALARKIGAGLTQDTAGAQSRTKHPTMRRLVQRVVEIHTPTNAVGNKGFGKH